MRQEILLPTAYLPPAGYFSLIAEAEKILVETEENYSKQTLRNRCTILTANGPQILVVPVIKGNFRKTAVKDAEIDYSKRWQQVHVRALIAAYGRSPFFQFYSGSFEKIILDNHKFLIDLNEALVHECLALLKLDRVMERTSAFIKPGSMPDDFRYTASPDLLPDFRPRSYIKVFPTERPVKGLSIIDLIFNTGPDAGSYL
jgi:hypothetical protein